MISATITTKKHARQRYNTLGDYVYDLEHNMINIFISECSNPDYEFLIAIHELVEAYLAKKANIPEQEITKFDLNCADEEPGDNPKAPYHQQHLVAIKVEQLLAQELNIDWDKYGQELAEILASRKNS